LATYDEFALVHRYGVMLNQADALPLIGLQDGRSAAVAESVEQGRTLSAGKCLEVIEIFFKLSRPWKVLENGCGP